MHHAWLIGTLFNKVTSSPIPVGMPMIGLTPLEHTVASQHVCPVQCACEPRHIARAMFMRLGLTCGKMRVPAVDQKRKVAAERPIIAYVKRPATASAKRCIGAELDCASSTIRRMSAITVASPARSERTVMCPSQLTVPAVTCSPATSM